MAFELRYDDRAGYVRATLTGEMDINDVKAFFQAATDFARSHGCVKVIVDLREFVHRLSTFQLYDLSGFAEQQGIRHIARVALLVNDSAEDSQDYPFVRAAFNNRGYQVRVFSEPAAASEWLVDADDPPSHGDGFAIRSDASVRPLPRSNASLVPPPCDMTFDAATGIGQITAHGTFSSNDFEAACRASIDFARRHQCLRVLVDYRQLTYSLSNPEIFRLFRSYETLGVNRNARVAYVTSASARNLGDLRFLEDLLVNHGFRVRAFVEIDSARQWLLSATN